MMRYFPFLYQFCYKPFLADIIRAKGITYNDPPPRIPNTKRAYYISPQGYFYSNRLAYYFEKKDVIEDIKYRITKYFDEFVVDEVQDIAGRDFNFLELLMLMDTDMLFVGDFYQLNKKTMEGYHAGRLSKLAPSTRNRLYVAITRARGNVYLIDESMCKVLM